MRAVGMAETGIILDADNAVQASIILLAAEGGKAVMGPTVMRMMVFLLLRKVGPIAGRGLGATDAHVHCDSGDVDAELRRLSDAGVVRCGGPGIEATAAGREIANALGEGLDERAAAILSDTKQFYNAMSDAEALVYTRAAYPDAAGEQYSHKRGEQKTVEDVLIGLVGRGGDQLVARSPAAAPRLGGCHAHDERGRHAGVPVGARGRQGRRAVRDATTGLDVGLNPRGGCRSAVSKPWAG